MKIKSRVCFFLHPMFLKTSFIFLIFFYFSKKIYNAKILKLEFGSEVEKGFNTDEFIINRIIWAHGNKLSK
jgi:hypothetical protein